MRKFTYKPYAVISPEISVALPAEANKSDLWVTQSTVVDLDNHRWRSDCRSLCHPLVVT